MPDDFLTIDEVASRLALPLEMIQRRIESGDIPVHWVEVSGKLEMRVSAGEIGVESEGASPTPFPTPQGLEAPESAESAPPADPPEPSTWSVRDSVANPTAWPAEPTPTEVAPPAAEALPEPESQAPWEVSPDSDLKAAELGPTGAPVWRADPNTWEDEPLHDQPEALSAEEPGSYTPPGSDAFFPAPEEPAPEAFPAPAAASASLPYLGDDDDEEAAPFAGDEDETLVEEVTTEIEVGVPLPGPMAAAAEPVDVPRPSALAAAQGPESALALNSLDARELVAGLFERWERALEQRIQAEQRLRFEAELERRMRQVRDLRQELENTRKATAAQLAEREQEVMALRNKLRDQDQAPRGRGLFRR
ncbi:MAG: hypothetical protein ACREN4_09165 [Candidatus Dormibacteria bacterium]